MPRCTGNLKSLSQYCNFTTIQASDGTMNIYLDGQQGLLSSAPRSVKPQATSTPAQLTVTDSNGDDVSSEITGGSLGAYLQAIATIPGYTAQLNTLAQSFATSVNTQLAAGVDANNNPGAALFTFNAAAPAGTLAVSSTVTPAEIAAASAGQSGWQRQCRCTRQTYNRQPRSPD